MARITSSGITYQLSRSRRDAAGGASIVFQHIGRAAGGREGARHAEDAHGRGAVLGSSVATAAPPVVVASSAVTIRPVSRAAASTASTSSGSTT
jgi:hypothetical protein